MGLDPSLATLTLPDNVTVSDFAKTLLDDTDAATARATLGVPEIATQAETDAGADDARIVTPAKLYATPGLGRRNVIINGDMRVAQRGTSFNMTAGYGLDRWFTYNTTDGTAAVTQDGSGVVTNDGYFIYLLKIAASVADASIGAAQGAGICYYLEGYDYSRIYGGKATLSFWVKSSKAGTYCVQFTSGGLDRSYVVEYTINTANTWEKKSITVDFTNPGGGTWNYTNSTGLRVSWSMAMGSNWHGTANSWQAGNIISTSNQVNWFDSASATFYLTGVQFERGEAVTRFEHRPFGQELALCQRYYEKSAPYGTVPGSNGDSRVLFQGPIGNNYINIPFCVRKRAVGGTIKVWSTESPYTVAKAYDYTGSGETNLSGTAFEGHMELIYSQTATNHLYGCTWSVESEL